MAPPKPGKNLSKQVSIVGMISMTVFLTFMDVKDLYYKINMCGTYPTFSFLLGTPETVTDYDVTKAIREANGTWISPVNMWNALAMQCDSFFPSSLPPGKPAHLSAYGVNCSLGGVKYQDERMFVGSHRLDTFLWATAMLGDIVDAAPASRPISTGLYGSFFGLDERSFRRSLAAMIAKEDIPAIRQDVATVNKLFADRESLWENALCYESMPMAARGETVRSIRPKEHGCIWHSLETSETVQFHVTETTGKYYRALCDITGLQWHTTDYVSAGSDIFLRVKMMMNTSYTLIHEEDGSKSFEHLNITDFAFDGLLYFVMIIMELLILYVNATDCAVVALNVVRPLITSSRSSVYSVDSKHTATTTTSSKQDPRESSMGNMEPKKKDDKADTLSKMLLYTDLASVSYRKPLLTALMIGDTLLAWLYIVPNSNIFAWGVSTFELASAYLSMFRLWVLVLIIIDRVWRHVFVVLHEKFSALLTEFTYITSTEIMASTLIGVALSFTDIMNICVFKYGIADGQRSLSPTTPTILSFYNRYTLYSWGDRSDDKAALYYIYYPLYKIVSYGILFSFLVLIARLIATVAWRYRKGTLGGEIEAFWRSYQRNSAEVFMNNPLRANALIRSQSVMSYRFGKSVFIRPFVYLEQNYYITRGKFRQRPDIPFLHNEDADQGADVDAQSYMLAGVFRDENSHRLEKKMRGADVQIPLC